MIIFQKGGKFEIQMLKNQIIQFIHEMSVYGIFPSLGLLLFFFLLTGPQCFISMYHNPISYNWFSCNFLCVYIYTYNCCPSSMKLTGE